MYTTRNIKVVLEITHERKKENGEVSHYTIIVGTFLNYIDHFIIAMQF